MIPAYPGHRGLAEFTGFAFRFHKPWTDVCGLIPGGQPVGHVAGTWFSRFVAAVDTAAFDAAGPPDGYITADAKVVPEPDGGCQMFASSRGTHTLAYGPFASTAKGMDPEAELSAVRVRLTPPMPTDVGTLARAWWAAQPVPGMPTRVEVGTPLPDAFAYPVVAVKGGAPLGRVTLSTQDGVPSMSCFMGPAAHLSFEKIVMMTQKMEEIQYANPEFPIPGM